MNTLASYFNATLMVTLFRMANKTSTDILIAGGLCGGIIISSLGCGPFCLVSLFFGTFAGGQVACALESFGHVTGMCVCFLSIASIAYRTYHSVVNSTPFTQRHAYLAIAGIYSISISGVVLSGTFSPTYIVSSGIFCFFEWSSKALTTFAWPLALIAGLLMIYWYYQTFKRVREIDLTQFRRDQSHHVSRNIAKRLTFLVVLFFATYATIMSLSFYELSGRRAESFYDILAACTVLTYWVTAPLAYARTNKRVGLNIFLWPFSITDWCHSEPESRASPRSSAVPGTNFRGSSNFHGSSNPASPKPGEQSEKRTSGMTTIEMTWSR
jgi:hypothetical protein